MARPTLASKQVRAETWMHNALGRSMRDHVRATGNERISVAIVDADRLMKLSKAPGMLRDWAEEDRKSPAGAKAKITATSALALLIVQKLLGRPTLLTEIQKTFIELSPRQLAVLGITHNPKEDEFVYDRIWAAVQRLIAVVDEYPGPRIIVTAEIYRGIKADRESQNCVVKRNRMFELANALIGATLLILPPEVRARWDGNVAVDATFIALGGKRGNPNADNLRTNRWSCNYDGGFYRPEGAHGAYAHDDVMAKVKGADGKTVKSTPSAVRKWGIELEVARMASNAGESEAFPLLTVAVSFHRPSEIKREAVNLIGAIQRRGDKVNYLILDRAYPNGLIKEFALPLRMDHSVKLVFDYKTTELDVQTFTAKGLMQVGGSWYIDSLPAALRTADKNYLAVRDTYRRAKENAMPTERKTLRSEFDMESELYRKQLAQRDKYRLKLKGLMTANGDRRYLLPLNAPGFAKWKAQFGTPAGTTLTLRLTDFTDARSLSDANRGGLKREQHLVWASEQWAKIYGLRNAVESANRSFKRSQYEDLGNADNRQVRGNTFTYLISAIGTTSENLRAIIDFFRNEIATKPVTSKNKNQPSIYYSSTEDGPGYRLAPPDAA